MLTSKDIRQMWLDYFESKGHEVRESKSLIPFNDPTLLWINSGVATLKQEFSGKIKPKNPRITNSQKAIRTNDIENVGVTARHHTLFEMLGNFSIGDYFKDTAIEYGYEFVFDILKFDKSKVYVTYFEEDKDTLNKWLELGIEPSHIIKGSKKTNFWDIGEGPCGPCTEIFYDRGSKYDPDNVGIKLLEEDLENDRYIEIWNIVFSQFNNDGEGNYEELSQKNIDTGAGLERIVSIIQDVPTNFDTDLFQIIIEEAEKLTGKKYDVNNYFEENNEQTKINKSFKVIADHMRAVVMAIQDGAKPSNTSRGYIIRRLIRRAYRSIKLLGAEGTTVLYKLVPAVKEAFGVYEVDIPKVQEIIKKEEVAFDRTIKQGHNLLMQSIQGKKELDAKIAFKLFDTYGYPIELTKEILDEKGIDLDMDAFNKYKEEHSLISKNKVYRGMESQNQLIEKVTSKISNFVGYDVIETSSEVIEQIENNGTYLVLTKETPFYATKGGQHADIGTINGYEVLDVFYDKHGNHWHVLEHKLPLGEKVSLVVDADKRLRAEANHSGTHLLGRAILDVLGNATQLGSDNNYKRLKLDFPADTKPTPEQLKAIENRVNDFIKKGSKREYIITDKEGALEMGAVSLEQDNYGEIIRVVDFPGISKEFCGGTHISDAKLIERFKIIKLESKGSGTYRIEAITRNDSIEEYEDEQLRQQVELIEQVVHKNLSLDSNYKYEAPKNLEEAKNILEKVRADNKELNKKTKQVEIDTSNITFEEIDGKKTYISTNQNPSTIKAKVIKLRNEYPDALIILEGKSEDKTIIAVASKKYDSFEEFKNRYPNAKGGGGPDFAMGSII